MKELYFITGNRHKLEEARAISLSFGSMEIVGEDLGYPEIQSDSLREIADEGAAYSYNVLKKPLIVEDSGLFIDALNGFPGPYSAYVFRTLGNQGIIKLLDGIENRKAHFLSVVGYTDGGQLKNFTGRAEGDISREIKGSEGFGFDPVFEVSGKTFGELSQEEKNAISHRKNAFEGFFRWFMSF